MKKEELWLRPFCFKTERFEVWSYGQCVEKGVFNSEIKITFPFYGLVHFDIRDDISDIIPNHFDISLLNSEILQDRIQYGVLPVCLNDGIYVCNIFTDIIRFAYFKEKLYIIEFWGNFELLEDSWKRCWRQYPVKEEAKFTREQLRQLIDAMNSIISQLYARFKTGDRNELSKAVDIINLFKIPLVFIWGAYRFGKVEEVWDEGISISKYKLIIADLERNIRELIRILVEENPFKEMDACAIITDYFLLIYRDLQDKMQAKKIYIDE